MSNRIKALFLAATGASLLAIGTTACNKEEPKPVPPPPTLEDGPKTDVKAHSHDAAAPKDHPAH